MCVLFAITVVGLLVVEIFLFNCIYFYTIYDGMYLMLYLSFYTI